MTTQTTTPRESGRIAGNGRAVAVALEPMGRLAEEDSATAVTRLRQWASQWSAKGTPWGYVSPSPPVVAEAHAAAECLPGGRLLAGGEKVTLPGELIRLAADELGVELRDLAVACLPQGAFWAAAVALGCAPFSPVDVTAAGQERSRWSRFQERALAWTGSQLDAWRLP